MKPLPNLLFVKTVAEIQEDTRTKLRLSRFINDEPRHNGDLMDSTVESFLCRPKMREWIFKDDVRNTCHRCGGSSIGTVFCGLCSSALVESQINAENLTTAR